MPIPAAQWGANLIPGTRDTREIGLHFSGFTRYGKEVDTTRKPLRYNFRPYNDIDQTYGFNLLTYSRMDNAWRGPNRKRGSSVNTAGYARRMSAFIGLIDDRMPSFLQNTVIHKGNLRGRDKLYKVPRDTTDALDHPSLGLSQAWPPVVGGSFEYFMRLSYESSEEYEGDRVRVHTPLFIGAGAAASTLYHDLFVHLGSSYSEAEPCCLALGPVRIASAGVGALARTGLLMPGHYFKDVASGYLSAQMSARVSLEVWHYPLQFDYTLTNSTGMFVASRSDAQLAEVADRGAPARKVYYAKSPIPERFHSLRIHIGQFTFETFNDSPGGKDKGPSFGASIGFEVYRPSPELGRKKP